METFCVKIALICIFVASVNSNPRKSSIDPAIVSAWTSKLGTNLIGMATYVSRKESIQEAYAGKVVVSRSGEQLLQEIAMNIQNMTEAKISAVKRIMDTAEETAMAHQEDSVDEDYEYYNAKKLEEEDPSDSTTEPPVKEKEGSEEDEEEEVVVEEPEEDPPKKIFMTENKHFYNKKVNTSFSVVHVPTNVFDGAPDILRAIKWSEHLNSIFVANYNSDPSLSWQYFGSSLGFMRQYPAAIWQQVADDVVDLYDCRTRPWYIEAATSPKDVVILVDNSGSMTGMRREIARHVVNDILDTLGPNDFVNVFNFSDNSTNVVPCFGNGLVQATLENVRELKLGMEDLYTDKIANFSEALTKAFLLLQDYRTKREGAACNQAIMLVTDGVPYNYKEIFRTYNWQDLPRMPVRVFTYLIGREVADVREVKWMACANQGFFVHLSTLSEVKEKVLEYIPVMARPLVLQKNEHPVIWTSVYADVADPKMTDWLWDSKESEEQKDIFLRSRKMNIRASPEEEIQKYLQRRMADIDEDVNQSTYQLMTSVSVPVYDRRENATRIANILGVAGTDVPVKDIEELMMPHKLGVNSYAFLVTNNGHIVIHPDFRPVFQGILKPSYNSVDMSEIELLDDDLEARDESEEMNSFRDAVITQSRGNRTLKVKYHYDKMKRAATATRKYFFCGIENTPFTLVISLPLPYGQYGIDAKEETSRHRTEGKNLLEPFSDKNWKIHPDWTYCRYHFPAQKFETPEEEFLHFLNKALGPGWHWLSKRTGTPPEYMEQSPTQGKKDKLDETTYFCDRDLFLSLVFDGKATASFPKNTTADSHKDGTGDVKEFQERYGVTVSFVATRSGLTRWKDYLGVDNKAGEKHFSEIHNRAIDEIWYKRAVDYHFIQPHSYVYSVPYEAGDKNGTLVTASYAIFHTKQDDDWKAPAAVIGFQFRHSALHRMLFNITSTCPDCPDKHNNRTCASNELECYVIDNNGYVVVAESLRDTGKFFGEIRASIMEEMVNRNMFKIIRIFDYQAVCFRAKSTGNCASYFMTPLAHLKRMIEWTIGYIFWLFANANLNILWFDNGVYASEEDNYSEESEDNNESPEMGMNENNKGNEKQYERWTINRTRPQPCDKEVVLYQMNPRAIQENKEPFNSVICKRFFEVQVIDQSNLILVVVDRVCTPDESEKLSVAPVEVFYNTSSLACFKVENMQRRQRPRSCISHHKDEDKIELCGSCGTVLPSLILLLFSWFTICIVDDWC